MLKIILPTICVVLFILFISISDELFRFIPYKPYKRYVIDNDFKFINNHHYIYNIAKLKPGVYTLELENNYRKEQTKQEYNAEYETEYDNVVSNPQRIENFNQQHRVYITNCGVRTSWFREFPAKFRHRYKISDEKITMDVNSIIMDKKFIPFCSDVKIEIYFDNLIDVEKLNKYEWTLSIDSLQL